MNGRIGREEARETIEKQSDRYNVRTAADNITDMLDEQALKNFEMNLQVNRYKSELKHALQQLDEHTYCPGDVDIHCKEDKCKTCKDDPAPRVAANKEEAPRTVVPVCCKGSKFNFLKKNKMVMLVAVIWVILIILAVGWAPTGAAAEAINNSWVELIVNFFKMALFAVAGIATYLLIKKENE